MRVVIGRGERRKLDSAVTAEVSDSSVVAAALGTCVRPVDPTCFLHVLFQNAAGAGLLGLTAGRAEGQFFLEVLAVHEIDDSAPVLISEEIVDGGGDRETGNHLESGEAIKFGDEEVGAE